MSFTRALVRSTIRRKPVVSQAQIRAFSTSLVQRDAIAFNIAGQGTGVAQHVSVSGSPHTIKTDAYAAFGGSDTAPSPLHFNLTALSSCTQVTGSVVANDLGIKLGKWDIDVVGHLDPAVLAKGEADNGNGGNWNAIDLKVKVDAGGVAKAEFEHWASEVERRCPVTQLFKRSGVVWKSSWTQA